METKLIELQMKLQLKLRPLQKRIQGLVDNKYLHWIENKGRHIEKNLKPGPCIWSYFLRSYGR